MARILIIDDDEAVRSVLTVLLTGKNHVVVAEPDGRRGLSAVQRDHFDLLIIDIFMPEMDGFETIRLVRQIKSDLPIVVISGGRPAMPDYLKMATKLGAIESIQKPFRPKDVFDVVDICLASASKIKNDTGV